MSEDELLVGFVLYPSFTGLDLVGSHEVLARAGCRCLFVAASLEPVVSERQLRVLPDVTFAECPPLHVLVVPGGPGQTPAMHNQELIQFLARQNQLARWTVSVCTGALLLAQAGVLRGRRATTHWLAMKELERLGAVPIKSRVVWDWDGSLVSGAGVSAGIDLALALVAMLRGPAEAQRIQLAIEYDPQPPFNAGSPDKAPASLVEQLRASSRFAQNEKPTP